MSRSEPGDRRRAILIAVAAFLLLPLTAEAQTFQSDLQSLLAHRPVSASFLLHQEDAPTPFHVERVSELKTALMGVIFLYQTAISTQDTHRCNFTPSCSRFGAACLKHAGAVKGVLLTSDRLMRCNGMPDMVKYYPFDLETGRFIDPLEKYIDLPPASDEQP